MAIDLSDFWGRIALIKDELLKRREKQELISPIPKREMAKISYRDPSLGRAGITSARPPKRTIDTTTAPREPFPVQGEPVKRREEPTPTPVQEYYRNKEIANALGNKDFAKKYNKATEVIEKYSQKYRVPVNLLTDIAFAESSLDPNLEGPTQDVGLFQFTPGTWQETMIRMGLEKFTPLENRRKLWLNTMAAAYLISQGELSRWNASKKKWGQYYTDEELKRYYGVG